MLRATKVRIYPTPEQEAFLTRQFGAVRFVCRLEYQSAKSRWC